jgi:hypothetical protein
MKIYDAALLEVESDRFRDDDVIDKEEFKKTKKIVILERGSPRLYYEKTATICGSCVKFRRAADGPQGMNRDKFDQMADHIFTNIFKIMNGIAPSRIFYRS